MRYYTELLFWKAYPEAAVSVVVAMTRSPYSGARSARGDRGRLTSEALYHHGSPPTVNFDALRAVIPHNLSGNLYFTSVKTRFKLRMISVFQFEISVTFLLDYNKDGRCDYWYLH